MYRIVERPDAGYIVECPGYGDRYINELNGVYETWEEVREELESRSLNNMLKSLMN